MLQPVSLNCRKIKVTKKLSFYFRLEEGDTENGAAHEDSVPPGYEVIPLISAINGPVTSTSFAASLSSEGAFEVLQCFKTMHDLQMNNYLKL